MRVAVVGAGGIGGLYGGLLARAGHEVSFLARGAHLAAVRERGLRVESADFGTFEVRGNVSDRPEDLDRAELILFAVKTYDLEAAARSTRQLLASNGSVLTFQNGVEAPDQMADVVGQQHVLIGTTGLETTIVEPGVIGQLTPGHYLTVSALHGPPTPQVERVADILRSAGINTSVTADGHRALWEKAWILIPMATITSICRAPIGPIRETPETKALVDALLDEVTAVARGRGYDLPAARERALNIILNLPPTMKSSMARDFERGNRTELDAITGALVRMADALGLDVPVARTSYAILKLREQIEGNQTDPRSSLGIAAAGR